MPIRSYKLSTTVQKKVTNFILDRVTSFDFATRRERMQTIDRAIQLENAKRRVQENKDRRRDYYDDIETAQISPAIDTIQGFFVDLFLAKTPIFPAVADSADNVTIVQQVDALNELHGKNYAWAKHFAVFFRDLAKYNIGATEVSWKQEEIKQLAMNRSTTTGGTPEQTFKTAMKMGNAIKRLDLYNTCYDTSVTPSEVHEHGEFAGYIERLSLVELVRRIKSMKLDSGNVMNEQQVFKAASSNSYEYFTPDVLPKAPINNDPLENGVDYTKLFDVDDASKYNAATLRSLYEVTTFYARIIPSMFGISTPEADDVQIWKFVKVGEDTLLYAGRMDNAHNYLPIIVSQLREDGLYEQTKSTAELLIPLQNLSTKLYDARMAGLARMVNDRFAYVDGVVDPNDVSSTNPIGKIRVRPNALYKDIRQVIQPLPMRDEIGPTFINEMEYINTIGERQSRLNRPQIGQFQRGNKTLGEFQTVMANANAELRVMGLLIENTHMHPTKTIIKYNIMQYQQPGSIPRQGNSGTIQVDPYEIYQGNVQFKLADGLITRDELVDTNILREFMQYIQSDPRFAQTYNASKVIAFLFGNNGIDLQQFEYSDEEKQRMVQQAQAQAQQQAAANNQQ